MIVSTARDFTLLVSLLRAMHLIPWPVHLGVVVATIAVAVVARRRAAR